MRVSGVMVGMAALLALGCGSDESGSGGSGAGGGDGSTVPETATIEITGAQTESWDLDGQENDFTCLRGTGSLDVLIRRSPSDSDDRVLVKLGDGAYTGPGTYSWTAMTGNFDQQVVIGVGSMFEYETDLIGDAVADCSLETSEPGTRVEGALSCADIPSAFGSADTPSDPNEPHPTVNVEMSFSCQVL